MKKYIRPNIACLIACCNNILANSPTDTNTNADNNNNNKEGAKKHTFNDFNEDGFSFDASVGETSSYFKHKNLWAD